MVGYESEDLIAAVLNWAADERNSWFDTAFVESLSDWLEDNDELTEGQAEALEAIISRNKIDVERWL